MKVSLNTIKFVNQHYGSAGDPAPEGVDALVHAIGTRLGAVEEVVPFGQQFEKVIIVKVVSCEKHPNADKLHLCKVDDDSKTSDVARDENGHVQVVCGAPNVHAGMIAAWLPPGATVPSTADKDPFVLEARDIRGQTSNGMLASPKELGISDKHDGILEIVADSNEHPQVGTSFAESYHLSGDTIIDLENKMFTHRPDCFGFLGVARELEGIQHRPYKSPEWYTQNPIFPGVEAEELKLQVKNELPELVPRFTAVAMRDVQVHDSPLWLQLDLMKAGIRPINNIVDYTNFFMLETGQPLHAYDYDKVKALDVGVDHATLTVRHPQPDEKLKLLNGKEVQPRAEAIMIATASRAIGVGGVMGGGETEVDEHTKNIIIECANFDMYSIRRSAMQHGLFTDAVTRFTKGQSPLQNLAVLAKITDEIKLYAGGRVASPVIDDNHVPQEVQERGSIHAPVQVTAQFINARLGLKLSAQDIVTLLTNVEFDVQVNGDELTVKAPFWRTDIEIPEDIVEEAGRLHGYEHLPVELPKRTIRPVKRDELFDLKARLRSILSNAGANEVLTYNFVHGDLLDKVGQDKAQAFCLNNALSPDLQYYRLGLTPSLLEKVHPNLKAGHDEYAIFEINKAHNKQSMTDEGVPKEFNNLALVIAASDKAAAKKAGAPYYAARKYLDVLAAKLGATFRYEPLTEEPPYQPAKPYDYRRSARVYLMPENVVIGLIGEFRPEVRRVLKLPAFTAGFEIGASTKLVAQTRAYRPLSRYPSVQQDISLRVPADATYQAVLDKLQAGLTELAADHLQADITPLDIYQKDDHKHLTFRLSVAHYQKTMKAAEVNDLLDTLATLAKDALGAERI